jgi:transposase
MNLHALNIAAYTGMEYETVKKWLDKYPQAVEQVAINKPDKISLAGAIITDRSPDSWDAITKDYDPTNEPKV